MKRRWKFGKFGLLLLVPLALYLGITAIIERNSWELRTIKTWAFEPRWLRFSPDSRTLLFPDGALYMGDVVTLRQTAVLEQERSGYFIENGQYMVGSSIRSVPHGKVIAALPKNFSPLGVLADQSTLIGQRDNEIFAWNWHSNRAPKLLARLKNRDGRLHLLSDKTTLIDNQHLWDLKTGKILRRLTEDVNPVTQLDNPPDLLVFIQTRGNQARIWNYKTGKDYAIIKFGSNAGFMPDVRISPDGTLLAVLVISGKAGRGEKHEVILWDTKSGKVLRKIEAPRSSTNDYRLAFSPDSRTLALATASAITLWRIK